MNFRLSKHRILIVASVIFYVMMFNWTYKNLVSPIYDYWGLSYNPPTMGYLCISWAVSIIPALWIPIKFRRPSLLLFYIQYFIIFIPSVFVLYHSSKPILPHDEVLRLILLMFIGLSIMQSIYRLPLLQLHRIRFRYFGVIFVLFMAALLGYVLLKLSANFRLANLKDIYEVRAAMKAIVLASGTRLGFYAQMLLTGFFLPFCFAVGVFSKRGWIIAFVAIVYLILFGVGGSKAILFSMVYMTFVYLWLTRSKQYVASAFVWGLSTLLIAPLLLEVIFPPIIKFWYVAVVHFRTFSIPSILIAQYYEFFQYNPVTYMSHVNGINLLIHFPYAKACSMIIGEYFYGRILNSNAGLWAGDGLAGFGPQGIVIISFVCAIVFYVLDCFSRSYDARFVAVSITFAAVSFTNTPLSTTLLSGGLGFLMMLLLVLPNKGLFQVAFKTSKGARGHIHRWRIYLHKVFRGIHSSKKSQY